MNTEHWFESLRDELLARNPFRGSEYFKRFAAGTLTREQAWGHIAQHYLLVAPATSAEPRHGTVIARRGRCVSAPFGY